MEAFNFKSEKEKVALTENDEDVSTHLGIINQARFYEGSEYSTRSCQGDIRLSGSDQQPGMSPLTFDDLQAFHAAVQPMMGDWTVLWFSDRIQSCDLVYGDDFRCVVVFGSIELAIKPLQKVPVSRIILGPGDVQDCLNAAKQAILEADPEEPVTVVTGQGSTTRPEDKTEPRTGARKGARRIYVKIDFEWKIGSSPKDIFEKRIQKWRLDACGGTRVYHYREDQYLDFLDAKGFEDPRMGRRQMYKRSAERAGGKFRAHFQPEKRRAEEMGASEEPNVSRKRPSTDSRPESAPSSSVSSPEISREAQFTGWAEQIMGPPPPVGFGQPDMNIRWAQSREGSQRSAGSAMGGVTMGLADMTVQSPSWGSPEGIAPPPEGALWGAPPQRSQRLMPQIPGSIYQGPGQGQQTPGYGQMTEVYGHAQRVEPDRPRGPPRVGFPLSQLTEHGDWNPPQPEPQRVPIAQAPAQDLNQRGGQRAELFQRPADSGYNVPIPSPNFRGGGSYTPTIPPRDPGMHRGWTHLPSQRQHMAAVPPFGGEDPSMFEEMPMTESPQLHPSAAQLGEGQIPFSLPPNVPPMLPSLPPPALGTVDPSQLQAATPFSSLEENYPSGAPPTAQYLRAKPTSSPEPEDEDASSDSDSESDEGNNQFSHQDTSAGQASLYPGGHGNVQYYQSPGASGGNQQVQRDPMWGGYGSEDEIGQD